MTSMDIWVDVYDASGNRLGEGPVYAIKQAQVTRALDGAGGFSFTVSATDERALTLLQKYRRIKLWSRSPGGTKRLLGQGIITKRGFTENSGGTTRTISGPDILKELKHKNSWVALSYKQETLSTVVTDLIAKVGGWSVTIDSSVADEIVEARFDGASMLKALQSATQQVGAHFRLSGDRQIEVGLFGDDDGRRIFRLNRIDDGTLSNDKLLIAQSTSYNEDSEGLVNVVAPIGAGEGIAALTLEKATHLIAGYPIKSKAMPDGSTLYYVEHTVSIAEYGEIEDMWKFGEIAPISNTEGDIINAANALYVATVVEIQRRAVSQETFSIPVKNVKENLNVGDKLHVRYKGRVINDRGAVVDYVDINGDYYMMRVSETVNLSGITAMLEISDVDQYAPSAEETIVKAIESVKVRGFKPMQSASPRTFVYARTLDPDHPCVVPIEITDATLYLNRVRVRVKSQPFRATAKSVASVTSESTPHKHSWASIPATPPTPSLTNRIFSFTDGTNIYFMQIPTDAPLPAITQQLFAINENPPHTHEIPEAAISYGIQDDTKYPGNMRIVLDGDDITYELAGPFGSASSEFNGVLDEAVITDAIINASGGMRQRHELEIQCTTGQGEVEVTVEIFEVSQAINSL